MNIFVTLVVAASAVSLMRIGAWDAPKESSPAQVAATSGSPEVAPDGRHIAFGSSRNGKRAVFVMDPDGNGVVRVSGAVDNATAAGWTSDGTLFLSARIKDSMVLFVASVNGAGEPREVGRVAGREGRVSPDGKSVITATGGYSATVFVVSAIGGSNPRAITAGHDGAFNARWSPDGKRIAYTNLDAAGKISVWVMNADGSNARVVTQSVPPTVRAQVPSWSHDGLRLAVQGNTAAPGDTSKHLSHIWTVNLATGAVAKIADHTEPYLDEIPSWFPDDRRIAFQSNRTGVMQVWIMSADGTGARALTR